MKRQIRLREFEANEIIHMSPSRKYVSKTRHLSNEISYRAQTDSNGYIVSGRKFNPTKEICIIGASLIENLFVRESHRWNTCLEKVLLESGRYYKLYNAGRSGATSLNVFNTLLNKVFFHKFDLVVYFISSNDFSATAYENSYWNLTKHHSNMFASEYNEEKRNYKYRHENDFDAVIKSMYTTAKNFNQNFWLATYPNLSKNGALDKLNNRLRNISKDNNFNLLDMDFLMQEMDIFYEDNFYDDLHLSEKGAAIFSNILFDFFKKQYIKPISESKISSEKLVNTKTYMTSEDSLTFDESIYCNSTYNKVSFNLIFDIENISSDSDLDEVLLVKLHFEDISQNIICKDLQYTEKLGWYFTVSEPHHKRLETSYSFEASFVGNLSMKIECQENISQIAINSIYIEFIAMSNPD